VRVLTLIDAFRMGGAETLLAPLASACAGAGIEMDMVGLSPPALNSEKTLAVLREAGVRPRSLNVRRLLDAGALPSVVREIRRSRCDVVHAHLEMSMTLAVPAARLARRPVVCTFHHVARPLAGRAAKREKLAVEAASRSSRALFVSEASRASFQQIYRPKATPRNWAVVHNGIDLSHYSPGPADRGVRSQLGAGSGPLVVLPAAFRDFKGIPVAIEGWSLLHRKFPNAVLALVGGGELEGELRRSVETAGLSGSVTFAGIRTDMRDVYRAADLVLLPSTHGENLPTVLIEAAGCGRAVAASRVGGVVDIVQDGETGLLFSKGDAGDLARTVGRLLADASMRERLGNAAVHRAREMFSAEAWVGRLGSIYHSAVDKR
jgi:glycosyltransferase involved in cell wall biosynthesis